MDSGELQPPTREPSPSHRLFVKITRDTLPRSADRYPFLYLERGRLEIDDGSVKWIDSTGAVIRLPIATFAALLLGPGTSVTHEAVKVVASANCLINGVGEDSLLFYATGTTPTSSTRNLRHQMRLAGNSKRSLEVARRMFSHRFPEAHLDGKTLRQMQGMEGMRVKDLYRQKAEQYKVGWKGRLFVPGKFELSDTTNRILTAANAALYALVTSVVISTGYSPHIGFIHSGSPLPFVYDIADLYKEHASIDLAFCLTRSGAGEYDRNVVLNAFRERVVEMNLLRAIAKDISFVLDGKESGSSSRE